MPLRDDVIAGLAAIDAPNASTPLALDDKDRCLVTVPMPRQVAALSDGQLLVEVRISRTGRAFSLRAALAKLRETPDSALLEALLQRHYHPDPVSGLTFALSAEDDAVVAVYHWILDGITPAQFSALFARFSTGTLTLLREIAAMARRDSSLEPVHPDVG
jgi:hypothetical protein